MLTQGRVSNRPFVLSPGPLGATVQTCPAWQAAGILRIQVVIRWTLTKQESLPASVVRAAAHVGLHTSYLCPGNYIPVTLPHAKAAGASWGTGLGAGARHFSSFHPF